MASRTTAQGLRPGNIDVHAHLLPEQCYGIPQADGVITLEEHDGQLHLGAFPLAITAEQISSSERIIADMDREDIAVRAISAPPYAFAVNAPADEAADYARRVNDGLIEIAARYPDRLIALGVLPVQDEAATRSEVRRLESQGVLGVSVPPVVGGRPLGDPELRHVLSSASDADLAVLVHPMQQMKPEYQLNYLQNLLGNPVESAAAIASVIMGAVAEDNPDLRILFVHGAGAAPALLGRWDHGWRMRTDVGPCCAKPPSIVFRDRIFADSLTHSEPGAALLRRVADETRIVVGSDYPFDMADPHPVASADSYGLDRETLRRNALRWLGI